MTDTAARAPGSADHARTDERADAVERARDRVRAMTARLPSPIRVALVSVIGFTLVLAGVAMLVLPGPGVLTIFLGFAVLAAEFTLAYRVLRRSHDTATGLWGRVRRALPRGRRG